MNITVRIFDKLIKKREPGLVDHTA